MNEQIDDSKSGYQIETKRLQDLLTPLSIIMGLQLSIFFYFIDNNWTSDEFVWAPAGGLSFSLFALVLVIAYGIFDPWLSDKYGRSRFKIRFIRTIAGGLVLISILFISVAIVTILNKVDYWLLW